ncbi:hypothetical protein KL918_004085 [Ogataea parapolymorpha]|uniref:Putative transcription factor kapC n=1 Tax=Ogataea parapolymorpha (strain ATCC 26012 / BCRC 20466 / JCM 22074 / NRRL Y-7560 / DL-1) TaxID=871575 RepID=W1QAW3_OGAPD|nr:hypothetical protein HPODL_03816 [Ogataea parapolymorpha DL-1]ESW98171.1 hypothetical protein HPODL_03816 [Ogataea parapolymorpha DL-1]KAG7866096.1 hypothetical protein KL918_004085 [Ogataea parapolymorpha]KAG7874750.1 hypothetical protein KL916_000994 [Ogataea parapolymorpha]
MTDNANNLGSIDPSFQKIIKTQPSDGQFEDEVAAAAAAIAVNNRGPATDAAQKQAQAQYHAQYQPSTGKSGANSGLPPPPTSASPPVHSGSPESGSPGQDENGRPSYHGKPLNQSKRAAQNRAAQKAFRQRRKDHIEELEKKLEQHRDCQQELESLRQENIRLKEYILSLQSKIISTGDTTIANPPLGLFGNSTPSNS